MSTAGETRPAVARPAGARSVRLRDLLPPILAALLVGMLWVASDLGVPAPLQPWTGRLQGFVTVFLSIFIEALPFLMAGVLVSSAIHLFVTAERVRQLTPRNPVLAALAGSLLGLAFPVCECGSIPATRRLLTKGAALPAGIAFALAAPTRVETFANQSNAALRAGRRRMLMPLGVCVSITYDTGYLSMLLETRARITFRNSVAFTGLGTYCSNPAASTRSRSSIRT